MTVSASYPAVLGVYSLRLTSAIGSGATSVDHKNITFWYVRQLSGTAIEYQPLAVGGLPSGLTKRCSLHDLITAYTPEPFHYTEHPVPVLESLADKLLEPGPAALSVLDKAEMATLRAILVDPLDIPASSDPGYGRAAEAVVARAGKILKALLCRCEVARYENRVRFSGFGVKLRKDGRFDESITYFAKALAIEKNDENVYFNMARAYYEMGDTAGCRQALEQALTINPEFPEAAQFARFLARKSFRAS